MTDYTKLIEELREESQDNPDDYRYQAGGAIEAMQSECAEHKENVMRNARQAVAFRAERDALQAENERLKQDRKASEAAAQTWRSNAWGLQAKLDALQKQEPTDLEAVQWRNIQKVVRAAADWAFSGKDHPEYGHCWLAVVNSLTAQDGLDMIALRLEPLAAAPKALAPLTDECQPLSKVLAVVREYLPPDGISAKDCLSKIIAIVDPWPLDAKPLIALKDEEISLMAHNEDEGDWNDLRYRDCWHEGYKAGARAVEAAHGIGGTP